MPKKMSSSDKIRKQVLAGAHAVTELRTDERVLARITDGIYRQPSSALRELIFNAYDADATRVTIHTDAPRFSQMIIEDDGRGMSLDVINHLIHHIGGSAKRTKSGAAFGISDPSNPGLSLGGRKLIGKIGIGLFSVAHLTRHFQIITKPENEAFRYLVDVKLNIFNEEPLSEAETGKEPEFLSGKVEIWRETAADTASHGTQIILLGLKEFTRELLQSKDRWKNIDEFELRNPELEMRHPLFHIGRVDPVTQKLRSDSASVPWTESDSPRKRFQKLYDAILNQVKTSTGDPTLAETLDYYFNMLWSLALASPIDYVDTHPFDITAGQGFRIFKLSNVDRDSAKELILKPRETVRHAAGLSHADSKSPFSVVVDGVELLRPVRFRDLPTNEKASVTTPLLFVAKCRPDLSTFPADATGGPALDFEGYFLWNPKVTPKENNGLIMRIGGASGMLFDDSFLRYEVSEQTRLRQITAEIFVSEGLDAALNIDRESFNYSHPHYQFMTRWVHRALRQIATRHKDLGSKAKEQIDTRKTDEAVDQIHSVVNRSMKDSVEEIEEPISVEFVADHALPIAAEKRAKGVLVLRDRVVSDYPKGRGGKKGSKGKTLFEEKIKAVAQLLQAHGLLKQLS